jgi:NAD(P)-dependent dehydrogenase (short-subunit alcohol dehydrogenase family)
MRVLLVTGGSRGIGAATALLAANQGWAVCVNYRSDREAACSVVSSIEAAGGQAVALQADVSSESEVLHMFKEIDQRWGRLDGLVNNAAILERQSRLLDMTVDRWQRIWATNITGSFLCAREAARRMQRGASIVNVSSVASRLGSPGEYVDYAASKGAIDTFTIGLAKELAPEGIRVNGVRPGVIHTDIHASGGEPGRAERLGPSAPLGRSGQPGEVANTIVWLLSEAASYITGSIVDVSGGR